MTEFLDTLVTIGIPIICGILFAIGGRQDRIQAEMHGRLVRAAHTACGEPESPLRAAMPWRLRWLEIRLSVGGWLGLPWKAR